MDKTIDQALEELIKLSPEEVDNLKPATMAEAVAKVMLQATQDDSNKAAMMKSIQLVTERLDGKTTVKGNKTSDSDEIFKQLGEAINKARTDG